MPAITMMVSGGLSCMTCGRRLNAHEVACPSCDVDPEALGAHVSAGHCVPRSLADEVCSDDEWRAAAVEAAKRADEAVLDARMLLASAGDDLEHIEAAAELLIEAIQHARGCHRLSDRPRVDGAS